MEHLTPAQQQLYEWLIEYIKKEQHAPSIRQMMRAMNLKSPAPIQSRLERLRNKGYIDWIEGKARTLRILKQETDGIPILGAIAAGGLVEPFTEVQEKLDLSDIFHQSDCFAVKVVGDSMKDLAITEGDFAILRPLSPEEELKNGEIVAARVEGLGTTLKHFHRHEDKVTLVAANPKYKPIEVMTNNVEIQGILIGVWRSYMSKVEL